jgi:surface antigen
MRRSRRRFAKYGLLAGNVLLLLAVSLFIILGESTPAEQSSVVSQNDTAQQVVIDELSAADIAATVATVAKLDEAISIQNQADSFKARLAVVPVDSAFVAKPQLMLSGASSTSKKDIFEYTTVAGESVSSIATKFNITSDSIRWSNDVTGEALAEGKKLWIPPRNGIVYVVKDGDTVDALAAKYRANKEQIIAFNDAELGTLNIGERILIPDGQQPVVVRQASVSRSVFSFGTTALYGGNGYTRGYCTWWAAKRRAEIGRPIPTNFGNAITWLSAAKAAGYNTGSTPQAGAVVWHRNIGGLGHVAFVERVNDDGSAYISDMNYPTWGRDTYRTVQPKDFDKLVFIY